MERNTISYPYVIEIKAYDSGFVVKLDKVFNYYESLEFLARTLYPRFRQEMLPVEICAGSC